MDAEQVFDTTIRDLAKEIHQNAVEHGWWEYERSVEEIIALIHSEWSEALEEYRKENPMLYFACNVRGTCFESLKTFGNCSFVSLDDDGNCLNQGKKPEGIAVELVDGCIRIFDYLGWLLEMPFWPDPHGYVNTTVGEVLTECEMTARDMHCNLPQIVARLHARTARFTMYPKNEIAGALLATVSVAFWWVKAHGADPVAVLAEKHEYNKTRPYRHSGKKC